MDIRKLAEEGQVEEIKRQLMDLDSIAIIKNKMKA